MDPISLSAAADALSHVSPETTRTWVRMAFALQDEFGDAAFEVWDAWSQGGTTYNAKDAKTRWRSLMRASGVPAATIGTLIWEANQGGWKCRDEHRLKLNREEAARKEAERQAIRAAKAAAEEEDAAKAAAAAQAVWDAGVPAPIDHPYLKRKGIEPHTLRHAREWVVENIDPDTGEVHRTVIPNALLVPIYSSPGRLSSIQAIFANKKNPLKRDKDFIKAGRTRGCYMVIGAITAETSHILLCEGYATGCSLHAATGWPVMVCFMAHNLGPVSKMVRDRLPKAVIVIGADNDQLNYDGTPRPPEKNTGVVAAKAAAEEVSAIVAVPEFIDLSAHPSDFNDLAVVAGLAIVKATIDNAINPPSPPAAQPPEEGAQALASPPPAQPDSRYVFGHDPADHFRFLGYDHENYYFMSVESRQVVQCTKRDFTETGLLELAPLNWWELEFPAQNSAFNKKGAIDWLIRSSRSFGVYDADRVRGRGAWIDNGRIVYHHGEKLSVDGVYTSFDRFASRYVYEMDKALPEPHDEPMTADMGEWLLGMAEMFRWTTPGSAALLLGWCALAPVCGALKWRPHLWITGGAGSGKSTVLNRFAHFLVSDVSIFAQGASSEAGIRQTLGTDARPVLFDESESREEADAKRIQNVLSLIRQASTESNARTLKGTAFGSSMTFHIRSMFCLASIQVAIKNQADIERLSILNLRSQQGEESAAETWRGMEAKLTKLAKEKDLPGMLFRRALNLLPVTLQSIEVFTNAFAERVGSQRDGDQYGTLLAGCWSMLSDRVPTKDQAFELIDRYDWSEHREGHDADDSSMSMAYLLESRIRINGGQEATIHELIRAAAGKANGAAVLGAADSDTLLRRYGMRLSVDNRFLLLSNKSREWISLIADTPFAADPKGTLLRIPGAHKNNNEPARFNGVMSKCIALPLEESLRSDH